jgi:hypothetical protein
MKLSELVEYRNQVVGLSEETMHTTCVQELNKIGFFVKDFDVLSDTHKNEFEERKKQLDHSLTCVSEYLTSIKSQVESLVLEKSREYFQESTTRYETTIINRAVQQPEYIKLDRHLPLKLPESDIEFLKNRVGRYCNWKYPGMIIHPGQESYIDVMVANDPLYLIDDRHELLEPAVKKFNTIFKNRLCQHVITENLLDEEILKQIPNNQFGLCLVYNYLNFRPYEMIQQYIKEIYAKLRSGGVLIMTINDCDRAPGVMLVEQKWCYYTPLNLVLEYAKTLGFTVEFTWTDGGASTWIELRKPGQLDSIRGGQTVATIIPKSVA